MTVIKDKPFFKIGVEEEKNCIGKILANEKGGR